jgi:hypothetical protein
MKKKKNLDSTRAGAMPPSPAEAGPVAGEARQGAPSGEMSPKFSKRKSKKEVNHRVADQQPTETPQTPPATETETEEKKEPLFWGLSPLEVRCRFERAEEVEWEPAWVLHDGWLKVKAYRAGDRLWKFICSVKEVCRVKKAYRVKEEGKAVIYAYYDGSVYHVLASIVTTTFPPDVKSFTIKTSIEFFLREHGIKLEYWSPHTVVSEDKYSVILALEEAPAFVKLSVDRGETPLFLPMAEMTVIADDGSGEYRIVLHLATDKSGAEAVL